MNDEGKTIKITDKEHQTVSYLANLTEAEYQTILKALQGIIDAPVKFGIEDDCKALLEKLDKK